MSGEDLFWELVEPIVADPVVRRSTMMGASLRLHGRFIRLGSRHSGALLMKLPPERMGR